MPSWNEIVLSKQSLVKPSLIKKGFFCEQIHNGGLLDFISLLFFIYFFAIFIKDGFPNSGFSVKINWFLVKIGVN